MDEVSTFLRVDAINEKAKEWEHEGFSVKANIGGWDRPAYVEGLLPDIRGKRESLIRLGFVDFDEGYGQNKANMTKLIESSKGNPNLSIRFYNISEDGTCKLLKIET